MTIFNKCLNSEGYSTWERLAIHELFPIKLVGGFIVVDYHAGCIGCSFCISRRHPVWAPAFRSRFHYDPEDLSPEYIAGLLAGMKSFHTARVPVRFGHNTDAWFQWEFGEKLYRLIPPDVPYIMLTRFPVDDDKRRMFDGQPNLLLKITITPSSRILNVRTDPDALVRTANRIPPENLFVLIGPIVRDNLRFVEPLLEKLPKGLWIDIKPLTVEGIPGMDSSFQCDAADISRLKNHAFESGFRVTDYFGCKIRRRLNRPFYKAVDAPDYIRRVCEQCSNRSVCFSPPDFSGIESKIRTAGKSIGLELKTMAREGHSIRFTVDRPTSRGDETFLSETANHEIILTPGRSGGEGGGFCSEDPDIYRRWEQTGMLPFSQLFPHAERIYRKMAAGMKGRADETA